MQISERIRNIFIELTGLYSHLDRLDRSYEFMDAVGEIDSWQQQQDEVKNKIDVLLESLTADQKRQFYSEEW